MRGPTVQTHTGPYATDSNVKASYRYEAPHYRFACMTVFPRTLTFKRDDQWQLTGVWKESGQLSGLFGAGSSVLAAGTSKRTLKCLAACTNNTVLKSVSLSLFRKF